MNNYLLIDLEDGSIPLTRVVAEDMVDALCKAIKGLTTDKILTVEDICESLAIELKEITNMTTYE